MCGPYEPVAIGEQGPYETQEAVAIREHVYELYMSLWPLENKAHMRPL